MMQKIRNGIVPKNRVARKHAGQAFRFLPRNGRVKRAKRDLQKTTTETHLVNQNNSMSLADALTEISGMAARHAKLSEALNLILKNVKP